MQISQLRKVLLPVSMMLFLSLTAFQCEEDSVEVSCYDETLVHNDACTQDCPGFIGCDGNNYCNECEAARQGIGPG